MRAETVIGPNSPGAGRSYSYSWPPQEFIAAGSQPTLSTLYRPNAFSLINQITNGTGGAPPGPQGATFYRGLHCYRVTADATSVRVFQPIATSGAPYQAYFPIVRPTLANLDRLDGFACWRVAALLAFDNPAGAVPGDLGITWCPGLNTTPRFGESGVTFGVTNTSTVNLTVVQVDGGARTFDQNVPAGSTPDVTNWHLYELRALGATRATEATLKACIDGRTVFTLPWGPGTVLPGLQSGVAGANLGYRWSLSNRGGAAFTTAVYVASSGIQIAAAPTETDLF